MIPSLGKRDQFVVFYVSTRGKNCKLVRLSEGFWFQLSSRSVYLYPFVYFFASVAQSNARPTGDQEVAGSSPAGSDKQHSFVEIDYKL